MAAFLVPLDPGACVIPLEKAILLVGRQADCDVVITSSRKISRKHCCIAVVDDSVVVRDLGSTNGCTVNGARVGRETRVRLGDELTIGDLRFRLQREATLPASPVPAGAPVGGYGAGGYGAGGYGAGGYGGMNPPPVPVAAGPQPDAYARPGQPGLVQPGLGQPGPVQHGLPPQRQAPYEQAPVPQAPYHPAQAGLVPGGDSPAGRPQPMPGRAGQVAEQRPFASHPGAGGPFADPAIPIADPKGPTAAPSPDPAAGLPTPPMMSATRSTAPIEPPPISLDFPVALPEDGRDFAVEASQIAPLRPSVQKTASDYDSGPLIPFNPGGSNSYIPLKSDSL